MPAVPLDLTGRIEDPYRPAFRGITQFEYVSRLVLAREPSEIREGAEYVLVEHYEVTYLVDGVFERLVVPAGMITDLVSVPRLARSLVGKVGPHLEAAIVHDFLYVAWQLLPDHRPTRDEWRFANAVMYAALDALGASFRHRFRKFAIQAALGFPVVSWDAFRETNSPLFVQLDDNLASKETGLIVKNRIV